jgi:hypothetical protein
VRQDLGQPLSQVEARLFVRQVVDQYQTWTRTTEKKNKKQKEDIGVIR